jgi:hypothetical protein
MEEICSSRIPIAYNHSTVTGQARGWLDTKTYIVHPSPLLVECQEARELFVRLVNGTVVGYNYKNGKLFPLENMAKYKPFTFHGVSQTPFTGKHTAHGLYQWSDLRPHISESESAAASFFFQHALMEGAKGKNIDSPDNLKSVISDMAWDFWGLPEKILKWSIFATVVIYIWIPVALRLIIRAQLWAQLDNVRLPDLVTAVRKRWNAKNQTRRKPIFNPSAPSDDQSGDNKIEMTYIPPRVPKHKYIRKMVRAEINNERDNGFDSMDRVYGVPNTQSSHYPQLN